MNPLSNHISQLNPEEQQAYAKLQEIVHKFGAIPEMGDRFTRLQDRYFAQQVQWNKDEGDVNYPFTSTVDGKEWKLRLNNFPDESMYTLIVDDKAIFTFDDMPETWRYPTEK